MSLSRDFYRNDYIVGPPSDSTNVPELTILGSEEERNRMADILGRVCADEKNAQIIQEAADEGYRLCFVPLQNMYGFCRSAEKLLILNPAMSDDRLVGTMLHEATHVRQFKEGLDRKFRFKNAKSELMYSRICEADAQQATFLAVCRLAKRGDVEPFKVFQDAYPAIGAGVAKEKGIEKNEAKVAMAAFDAWFDQEGIKQAYEDLSFPGKYAYMNKKGFGEELAGFQKMRMDELTQKICRLPDGRNYFSKNPNLLNGDKYADITPETKAFFKRFEEARAAQYGERPDNSLDILPERPRIFTQPHASDYEPEKLTEKYETFCQNIQTVMRKFTHAQSAR